MTMHEAVLAVAQLHIGRNIHFLVSGDGFWLMSDRDLRRVHVSPSRLCTFIDPVNGTRDPVVLTDWDDLAELATVFFH